MKDGGGYAFPNEHLSPEAGPGATEWHTGMTMRQWYKGQALIGIMTSPGYAEGPEPLEFPKTAAILAAVMADALIAEDRRAEKGGEECSG